MFNPYHWYILTSKTTGISQVLEWDSVCDLVGDYYDTVELAMAGQDRNYWARAI